MSLYHDSFDFQISCEETFNTDPAELAEVNQLMVAPESEWDGYTEWSQQVESEAWDGAVEVETDHGAVMVKPQCERTGLHKDCSIYQCKRAVRLEGIEI